VKADSKEEILEKIELEFKKIEKIPPYYYSERMPSYPIREKVKGYGWKLYSIALEEEDYLGAAKSIVECVIWSHYWRCRQVLENIRGYNGKMRKIMGKDYYKDYRLEFDYYAKNWIHANKDTIDQNVIDALQDKYGYDPVESEFMGKGCTYYTL